MQRKSLVAASLLLFSIILLGFCDNAFASDGPYRAILKAGGLIGLLLGIVGISFAGYFAGKSYDSYTGWERFTHGAGQFFNRKPFQKESPTYEKTAQSSRLRYVDNLEGRLGSMMKLQHPPDGSEPKWTPSMGMEALPELLKGFYQEDQEAYPQMIKAFEFMKKQQEDWPKWATQFAVADAWSSAMGSLFDPPNPADRPSFENVYPPEPQGPPEEWDFRGIRREKPLKFKSPQLASQLIKKITHTFGATLVGITIKYKKPPPGRFPVHTN